MGYVGGKSKHDITSAEQKHEITEEPKKSTSTFTKSQGKSDQILEEARPEGKRSMDGLKHSSSVIGVKRFSVRKFWKSNKSKAP